ncbi:MAG TPA: DUF6789 family protein [Thermomicrobiaceae bacterium]|nr:DUF6789 family protein [Thermomicrobiaceae bacterium]
MNRVVRGGLAGLVATGAMSGVMAGGRYLGLLGTPPPKKITAHLEQRVGIRNELSYPEFQGSWLASHFGYGTANGALFGLLRPLLPLPDALAGLGYGMLLWAVSYLGIMPGLGLHRPATRDSLSKQGVMVAAHLVYGFVLARANARLAARAASRAA